MKYLTRSVKISITMCSVMLLSACTQGKVVNTLQKDFDRYKYSDYVRANLKIKTPLVSNNNINTDYPTQNIAISKRYSQTKTNINSMIVNNGLFKPATVGIAIDTLSKKASLNSVLSIAIKRNLDIKSAKQLTKASLEKYNQVEFLSDTLQQYSSFTDDLSLIGSAKKKRNSSYPAPGLNTIKSSVIDESVKYSNLKLKQTTQDVITSVHVAYIELQAVQQEMHLLRNQINKLKILKQELQNNYVSSIGDIDEVLKADIGIAKRKNRLNIAINKQGAQQARLNALLNLPSILRFQDLDKLNVIRFTSNIEVALKKAHQNRVEIALLKTQLAKMQLIIKLSEKRLYSDLDAGFSRLDKGKFTTKPKIKSNQFFAKNDAYLEETRQKAKALSLKVSALKNTTSDELQQSLSNIKSAQSTYQVYKKTIIPKANTSLEVAKNYYESSSGDRVSVINEEIDILKYRLLLLSALREMNISKARAVRLMGSQMYD